MHELALALIEESEQVGGLNEPPAPPSLHEMVPVGEEGDEAVSVTEAVKEIAVPAVTDDGLGETAVAVLLILGLFTRPAALVGLLLALNLSLTVAFLNPDVGARWLYYLALLVNAQVLFGGAGPLALDRRLKGPRWLRS